MTSERSKSRQSPSIRIYSPESKLLDAGQRTKEGEIILQKLQSCKILSPAKPNAFRRKSFSCFGLDSKKEDIRTIHEKVKSSETLSSRSTQALELLQNCKVNQLQRNSFDATVERDTIPLLKNAVDRRCRTAEISRHVVCSESGMKRSTSASVRHLKEIEANRGKQNDNQQSAFSVKNTPDQMQKKSEKILHRRGSLPVETLSGKAKAANSILQKYSSAALKDQPDSKLPNNNRVKSMDMSGVVQSLLPMIKRTRSVSPHTIQSLTPTQNSGGKYQWQKNGRHLSDNPAMLRACSPLSCGSDEVDDTESMIFDSSEFSNSEDEDMMPVENNNRNVNVTNNRIASESKSKKNTDNHRNRRSKASRDKKTNENSSDEDMSENSCDDAKSRSKTKRKSPAASMLKKPAMGDDAESTGEDDCDVDGISDIADSANNAFTPGMPAPDLSSIQQEINHNISSNSSKKTSISNDKLVDSDEDSVDDVDDLIDTIDDIIEADDEDIVYEANATKEAQRRKSFKSIVSLVTNAKKIYK